MNVLVTGATGYLGGWVVEILRACGHAVVGTGSRDPQQWFTALAAHGFDAVAHLAWYASAGDGQPELQQRCLDATRRLLRHPAVAAVPRFVFPSTLSVYGANGLEVSRETDWTSPQCAYTRAKATAEWAVQMLLPGHTIFRLGSLMGRGAPGGRTKVDLCVNAFAADAYYTGVVEVWSPEAHKPTLHVRDAAALVARACAEPGWGGVWNAHDGRVRTAGQIAGEVCELTGAQVRQVGDANGAARRSCRADVTKLSCKLREGHAVLRTVADAVREFADYRPTPGERSIPWR